MNTADSTNRNLLMPVPSEEDRLLAELFAPPLPEGGQVQRLVFSAESIDPAENPRVCLARRQREALAQKLLSFRSLASFEAGLETVPYQDFKRVLELIRFGLWLDRARWANYVLKDMRTKPEGKAVYFSRRTFQHLEFMALQFLEQRHLAYLDEGEEMVGVMTEKSFKAYPAALLQEDKKRITVRLARGEDMVFDRYSLNSVAHRNVFLIRPIGMDLDHHPLELRWSL